MFRGSTITLMTIVACLGLVSVAGADQAMNCIQNGGANKSWVLPASSSSWIDLSTTTITAESSSDVFVTGKIGLSEDNVPGSKIV